MASDGGVIDLGDGLALSPSTEAEFAWINAHLRPGDRAERDVFGEDERIANYERVWTVYDRGEAVAYVGFVRPRRGGDPFRGLAGLTSGRIGTRVRRFVRRSPEVVNAVLNTLPPFVREVYTVPLKEYAGAVRWLGRVLGFSGVAEVVINGRVHVVMKRRKR